MKRIVILGATGSIGQQTIEVVRQHPELLKVVGLVGGTRASELIAVASEFPEAKVVLFDENAAHGAGLLGGMATIIDLVTSTEVDLVVVAVAGVIGLLPTIAAIKAGKDIALASKEVLVAAGEIVMPLVERHKIRMTPVDSEHSAVFQCLQGAPENSIHELILTASGGPFRGKASRDLQSVTVQEALNHPTWAMGGKITIDSATLMNKGLEIIEAKWLFDIPLDQVKVVVHPQSIIHSLVKFKDGSVLGQLGWPNMRLPIQYALLYPERPPSGVKNWNPTEGPSLTFEEPDLETFRSLNLAREAEKAGKTMPCAMNAANEEAANAFLRGECGFLQIAETVEEVMTLHTPQNVDLETLLQVDLQSREQTQRIVRSKKG
ncbi:MAG: 1-deoxy-D-xylulose-5-phosphate reductoisomerase [Armatimonadetes bacterium]|nr:1-deoxy-D-xylulose-5-phosphate reductoisomerase [Armatimonadota bacterium]